MTKRQKKSLLRIILTVVLIACVTAILKLFPSPSALKLLYVIPYFLIGHEVLLKAVKGIRNRQPFDENLLMAVATIGALCLGDFLEAAAVMLFYELGELFESYAVGKSRRNISALMDIRPDYANIENELGEIEQVDPDEVAIGTTIIVRPGEKVPIDGIIMEGTGTLDTSALTGESVPQDVSEGCSVISGCISLTGVLKIETTKEFGDSTVSKILDLVENATSRKSRSENFISKFARIYTPAVCFSALALAVLPPVVSLIAGASANWGTWIYRALTFLVISCPCALVISIPLSFFAGIGCASKEGILIKGSNYMETLSKVQTVVFDKTGTLTKGTFEVAGIHHNRLENEALLELAAYAESYSSHPISLSICGAYGKRIDPRRIVDVKEYSGEGVYALVDGKAILAGNDKLMNRFHVAFVPCRETGTVVHIAVDGIYEGHILITDTLKDDSERAISLLKKIGVRKTVMLTGDEKKVAEEIAGKLRIDEVYSKLLPSDKVSKVEELLSAKSDNSSLAFVGDGINDAPVLSRADIGIAMGSMGSDAAIEAADVVLMDDNPLKLVTAISISRKCLRIVYENIWFAIGVKLICLILGALGIANMWTAIFADVGVMMLAVLNAIRALRINKVS